MKSFFEFKKSSLVRVCIAGGFGVWDVYILREIQVGIVIAAISRIKI